MDMDGSKDTSKAVPQFNIVQSYLESKTHLVVRTPYNLPKLNKILKLVHIRNVSSHIANTDKNPGIQNFIA